MRDDGDGLERRSLTGTARLRRANTNSLTQGVARSHLPRHLARGRYVVAALRAACRSETGAPSGPRHPAGLHFHSNRPEVGVPSHVRHLTNNPAR